MHVVYVTCHFNSAHRVCVYVSLYCFLKDRESKHALLLFHGGCLDVSFTAGSRRMLDEVFLRLLSKITWHRMYFYRLIKANNRILALYRVKEITMRCVTVSFTHLLVQH